MGTFNNEWNLSSFFHTFSLQHSNNLNTIFSFYSVTFAYLNTFSMIKFKAFVLFFFFVRSFIVSQFEVLYDSTNMHTQFSVWGLASMAPSLPGILGFFPCVWSLEKVVKVEEMFAPHNFHMEVYTWCSWISFSLSRMVFLSHPTHNNRTTLPRDTWNLSLCCCRSTRIMKIKFSKNSINLFYSRNSIGNSSFQKFEFLPKFRPPRAQQQINQDKQSSVVRVVELLLPLPFPQHAHPTHIIKLLFPSNKLFAGTEKIFRQIKFSYGKLLLHP